MIRTVWLILAGAVAGAAVTALYLGKSETQTSLTGSIGGAAAPGSGAPDSFASSLAVQERAASAVDTTELAASIERMAAQRSSWRRDAEIRALLTRLVEMDARAAIDQALRLGLSSDVVARLFQAWAETDPDGALDGLGGLRSVSNRRVTALALLEVFGLNEGATERIAAVLPQVEANNFRIDAIGKMAEQDLRGALERALMLPPTGQAETVAEQRIAVVMARIDPLAALELQNMIPNPTQRTRYRDRLLDEWAKTDPAAVLAYLETSSDLTEVMVGEAGFRALATSAPEKLLALSDGFAPQQRERAQAAAFEVLAALDPALAFERINSLPPSGNRESFVAVVAERYAAQDPEGALAWASTLQPRPPVVVNAVLSGIAATDPVRAADLVIAEILNPVAANRAEMPSLTSVLSASLQSGSPAIGQVADRLAASNDPRVSVQLDSLILGWSGSDPDAAVAWALRNTDQLRAASAANFGRQVAMQDPALAQRSLQRMPPSLRGAWVEGVASGWADQDRAGAEGWVLGLPRNESRDGGLGVLLQRAATEGTVGSRLLDAFSSDEARARALSSAMPMLGASNVELGRRLIADYIRDPQLREAAERQLELGAEQRSSLLDLILAR